MDTLWLIRLDLGVQLLLLNLELKGFEIKFYPEKVSIQLGSISQQCTNTMMHF